ncbi:glutaminase [Microbacterium limosum]|uniref:Glutaminase n=1 Tax=Microbacterium limosum TaxID=3079935 RepID=A0AAU0MHT6_9MICO|nr:glutaminase [Microbacterium sp. Y20]WOQ69362.1 glutaminase [Microbacterium sp. Y20]
MTDAAGVVASARRRLAGAPRARLGELVTPRLFAAARGPRVVPRGEAWHLGVLLIADDALLATGEIVRAHDPGRRGFTAQASRERAELALAALRGGFAEGETVHVGWHVVDLDAVARGEASGPVTLVGAVPSVRWSRGAGRMPLAEYLDERIALLLRPPQGA